MLHCLIGDCYQGLESGSQQRLALCLSAFQQGLCDLGYVEGYNIRLEYRYAEDHTDRLPVLLAWPVQLAPDLISLHSMQAVVAAQQAATTVPIVIGMASDMVEQGLVASLARPGATSPGWISVSLHSWQNSSKG